MKVPMTAGAGPEVHTYMAGWFENELPVPQGATGCHPLMIVKKSGEDGQMMIMGCHNTKIENWVIRWGGFAVIKIKWLII